MNRQDMVTKIKQLKQVVIEKSRSEEFIHHPWFIERHLSIVEKLVEEICDLYPEAERDICRILVWFHDFGKPLDFHNEKQKTREVGVQTLRDI